MKDLIEVLRNPNPQDLADLFVEIARWYSQNHLRHGGFEEVVDRMEAVETGVQGRLMVLAEAFKRLWPDCHSIEEALWTEYVDFFETK